MESRESDEECRKAVAKALGYDPDHKLLPVLEQLLKEVKALRQVPSVSVGPMGLSVQCSNCGERVWRYEIVDRIKNECYRCRIIELERALQETRDEYAGLPLLLEQILQDEGKTLKVEGYGRAIIHAIDVVIALRDGHNVATAVATALLKSEAPKVHTTISEDGLKWHTDVLYPAPTEDEEDDDERD